LLRRNRDAAGLTQEELAERSGLTAKAVGALERGERTRPYPHTVRALSDALDLDGADRAAFLVASRGAPSGTGEGERLSRVRGVPGAPTALIGRTAELELILGQLVDVEVRMLTLLGSGGVGKTRLAMAAAYEIDTSERFPDGVTFVDLTVTRDPAHVDALIARALEIPLPAVGDPTTTIQAYLRPRRLLLVLDNFEHLLDAAVEVGRLLHECPFVVVLATSREPLRLRWERTLQVSPLSIPDPRHLPSPDRLAEVASVALFLERTRATSQTFELTPQNAQAIAELCVRLDGLPLAIELVAARAGQLGPSAILDRIAKRLPVTTSGMLDAPERQQSLRSTLEWSLDLLQPSAQVLFSRLSVFAGGWDGPAAAAIGANAATDIVAELVDLADRSLITVDPSPQASPRFRMLETAREVALDLLAGSGAMEDVQRAHAMYFAALIEGLAGELQGARHAEVATQLELETDNVRQALHWVLTSPDPERLEVGLKITGALGWFWFLHGYPPEARGWFDLLLDPLRLQDVRPVDPVDAGRFDRLRARALNAAGFRATDQGEYALAAEAHRDALGVWARLDDVDGLVASLHGVGDTALWQGDIEHAQGAYDEGLELAKARGSAEQVALFKFHVAQLGWLTGKLDDAEANGQEALSIAEAAGSTTWPPYASFVLASIAHERGDPSRAGPLYRDAIRLAWGHGDRLGVRMALPGLAGLATLEGDPVRALRLAGAANALEENAGIWAFPPIRERHERWLAAARDMLDESAAAAAWRAGHAMSIDEAIDDALEPVTIHPGSRGDGLLSNRETEVLNLIAAGMTNRQIGEALFVTEHTAKYHVTSLFNKLGVSSRAEAVARGTSLGLLDRS